MIRVSAWPAAAAAGVVQVVGFGAVEFGEQVLVLGFGDEGIGEVGADVGADARGRGLGALLFAHDHALPLVHESVG